MTGEKRILILTSDAGFGHRSAANAIAAALQETRGDRCVVEIVNPLEDNRVPTTLRKRQTDYDRIVREMPNLYRFGYRASDAPVPSAIAERALTVMLFEAMHDIVQQHRPDAIVTTYPLYQAPLGAIFALSRHNIPLLTVVTDLATVHRLWFYDAVDLCLVPTSTVRELAIASGLFPDEVQITGIPVHPNFAREDREPVAIRAALGWQPDLTTVLAVGSKRVRHLGEVLRALNHSGLPLQLVAVAGGDEELYGEFQSTEWHTPTHVYNFVENMPTLMHAVDCVVCKAGGLIVTESLACGLPLLLVDVLPGQETGNAEFVVKGGAGELGEKPIDVLEIMYHWLDQGGARLAQHAQNARRLGRPRAAYDVAELAWAAAERGPHTKTGSKIPGRLKLIALLKRHGVPWRDKRLSGPEDS